MAINLHALLLIAAAVALITLPAAQAQRARTVLEDYSKFSEGWEARGGKLRPTELYQVVAEPDGRHLRSIERPDSVRIFKKMAWDSAAHPIIEWKWRVKKWPAEGPAQLSLYVSLDTDTFGIPTILKYTWSRSDPDGAVKEGGFFRPVEIVVQSGDASPTPPDGWIVERVDARADFERFMGRAPRGAAYGIGLLADAGMIVDVGEIAAQAR